MNMTRIKRDIEIAQNHFDYVEVHPTSTGRLMVLVALQTSIRLYTLEIRFPQSYPNQMPEVFVRKPSLETSPHIYSDKRLCYLHPSFWNPGRHDLCFVIARAAKWLSKYEVYCSQRRWPGASIAH